MNWTKYATNTDIEVSYIQYVFVVLRPKPWKPYNTLTMATNLEHTQNIKIQQDSIQHQLQTKESSARILRYQYISYLYQSVSLTSD